MKQPDSAATRQLQLDWLDALAVFKSIGLQSWVKPLFTQTEFDWCEADILPVARTYRHFRMERFYGIEMSPAWLAIPSKVERVEILCYLGAQAAVYLVEGALELEVTCRLLGCAPTALATVRERWRRIQFTHSKTGSAVAALYEDRTACAWCKGMLATGSRSLARPDLHEGCHQFILTDVQPRLKRAKLAQEVE